MIYFYACICTDRYNLPCNFSHRLSFVVLHLVLESMPFEFSRMGPHEQLEVCLNFFVGFYEQGRYVDKSVICRPILNS